MSKELSSHTVDALYGKVSQIIDEARSKAYRSANFAMVQAYWHIGQLIVEEEQKGKERAEYGEELIKQLSKKLINQYGKGFHKRNLWYMKQFYLVLPKVNALRSELSWTHYRLLLKVEKEEAREFYMQEAVEGNWSTRTLERQINSLYYERMLMSRNESRPQVRQEAEDNKQPMQPGDVIKDPYVLDFLGLQPNAAFYEEELEQAIIDQLQSFLLELGNGFSFVARQYRFTTESGKHFYIDLLFYNYILKCFLLIDLKAGELTHQDIGQMDMYVRYFEDQVRQEDDNPTIGLVLCTKKDETVVQYSVLNENEQLFASRYKTYLPSEQQLKQEIEREREIAEWEKRLK